MSTRASAVTMTLSLQGIKSACHTHDYVSSVKCHMHHSVCCH